MESIFGKGKGIWAIYRGEKCWLSMVSKEEFKNRENMAEPRERELIILPKENGRGISVQLDQLALAE